MRIAITTVAVALFVSIVRATAAETGAPAPVAPRFLSQTGLYADAATLKIDARNRSFSPQYPLWSDGANKRRWVRLPAGSQIDVANLEKWELPVGTRFWKEFNFKGRKVETRFLWRVSKDRWVFASYAWNNAQTDAELASENGIADIAEVANGKSHSIPSVSECRSCHDSSRTEILGFNALQLSDDRDPNALHAEPLAAGTITLRTLVDENMISPPRPDLVANPPRIEAGSPIMRTALGYLSTNCGSCHNRESSIASLGLDLKQTGTGRRETGTTAAPECSAVGKRGHWFVPEAMEESRIINPGHPESSALIRRVTSRRPMSQMPPIGTVIADTDAIDLLTSWVKNNPDEWRAIVARCTA
ncbi:MAG TPA: c-type cytochrome domain-containing protein [Vicinamibacterales bacterium]|nr:c-type cytochrome domain-containing protein [Vicinamibacterales bacterium]